MHAAHRISQRLPKRLVLAYELLASRFVLLGTNSVPDICSFKLFCCFEDGKQICKPLELRCVRRHGLWTAAAMIGQADLHSSHMFLALSCYLTELLTQHLLTWTDNTARVRRPNADT